MRQYAVLKGKTFTLKNGVKILQSAIKLNPVNDYCKTSSGDQSTIFVIGCDKLSWFVENWMSLPDSISDKSKDNRSEDIQMKPYLKAEEIRKEIREQLPVIDEETFY